MKLTIAKSAGYCFGVKRAVNMVYQEAEEAKVPVYTYGPIIHNEEVVRDLKQRGVHVVRELKELENLPKGKIIIRSHGISRREHEAMKACGFECNLSVCPENSPACGEVQQRRVSDCDCRKRTSPGSGRNSRMGGRTACLYGHKSGRY